MNRIWIVAIIALLLVAACSTPPTPTPTPPKPTSTTAPMALPTAAPRVLSTAVVPSQPQPVMQPSPTPRPPQVQATPAPPRVVSTVVVPSQPPPDTRIFDRAVADLTAEANRSQATGSSRITERNLINVLWKIQGKCPDFAYVEGDLTFYPSPERKLRVEGSSMQMTYEVLPDGRIDVLMMGNFRLTYTPTLAGSQLTLTGRSFFYERTVSCRFIRQ